MDNNANENTQSGTNGTADERIPGIKGGMSSVKVSDDTIEEYKQKPELPQGGATTSPDAASGQTSISNNLPPDPQEVHGDPDDGAD